MFANDFLTCKLERSVLKRVFEIEKKQNTNPRTLPIVTATRVNAQTKLSYSAFQTTQISIITTEHSGIACKYFTVRNT